MSRGTLLGAGALVVALASLALQLWPSPVAPAASAGQVVERVVQASPDTTATDQLMARIDALEKQLRIERNARLRAMVVASASADTGAEPVAAAAEPEPTTWDAPRGKVSVDDDGDGGLVVVNRDPELTGQVLRVTGTGPTGETRETVIIVPPPS